MAEAEDWDPPIAQTSNSPEPRVEQSPGTSQDTLRQVSAAKPLKEQGSLHCMTTSLDMEPFLPKRRKLLKIVLMLQPKRMSQLKNLRMLSLEAIETSRNICCD